MGVEVLDRKNNVRRIEEFRNSGAKMLRDARSGEHIPNTSRHVHFQSFAQPMDTLIQGFEHSLGRNGKPTNGWRDLVDFWNARVIRKSLIPRGNRQCKTLNNGLQEMFNHDGILF